MTKFKALVVTTILIGLLIPSIAYQVDLPLVKCNTSRTTVGFKDPCTINHLLAVPVIMFNFLLGLAGLVLLAIMIWAAARMILFNLSEMPEAELVAAKNTFRRGIFGFMIVAFSYLLVVLVLFLLGFDCSDGSSYYTELREFLPAPLFWC